MKERRNRLNINLVATGKNSCRRAEEIVDAEHRALGLANIGHRERHTDRAEEYQARREAIAAATERLGQLTAERQLSEDVVRPLLAQQRDRLKQFELRS